MRKILELTLVLFTLNLYGASSNFTNRLDSAADIVGIKYNNFVISRDKSFSGGACGLVDSSLGDGLSYAKFSVPGNPTQGVLTFWVYNTCNLPEFGRLDLRFDFKKEDNKVQNVVFKSSYRHSHWYVNPRISGYYNSQQPLSVQSHSGWTRFDVVNPAGAEPQHFIVYIDGQKAWTTQNKFRSINAIVFTGHNSSKIYVDDVSYNNDASKFRPNVIGSISDTGDKDGNVLLKQGEKLKLGINVCRKGARSDKGKLTISLISGQESTISKQTIEVDWTKQHSDKIPVVLPRPSRSGYYWLEAKYEDRNIESSDIFRRRIDIQFEAPGYTTFSDSILRITDDWDFIPTAERYGKINNQPEKIAVPKAPPTDWSKAFKLRKEWRSDEYFIYPFWNAGWYHRELKIPGSFKGKRIILDICDPRTVAYIFINGDNIKQKVVMPGGMVDISQWAEAGKTISLDLFVVASPNYGNHYSAGPAQEIMKLNSHYKANWDMRTRGLLGPVSILGLVEHERIDSVAIETSVRQRRINIVYEMEGLIPGKDYTVVSEVSTAGKSVLRFPDKKFTAKFPKEKVMVSSKWKSPILWDFSKPYMYDLDAKLLNSFDKTVYVMYPERFGFREFYYNGRLVMLNETPITLFTDQRLTGRMDIGFGYYNDIMKKAGYNFQQKCGRGRDRNKNLRSFDEVGMGMRLDIGRVMGLRNPLVDISDIKNADYWSEVERGREYLLKKYRNHPSVLCWLGPFNVLLDTSYCNPQTRDGETKRDIRNDVLRQRNETISELSRDIYYELDPTRVLDCCNGSTYDNICGTLYLNFSPLQEITEYNEYWRKYGTKPIFIEEEASPFQWDWLTSGGHDTRGTIPQIGENCARYLGQYAFIRDEVDEKVLVAFETTAMNALTRINKINDKNKREKALEKWRVNFPGAADTLKIYTRYPNNIRNDIWTWRIKEQLLNWRADRIGSYCGQFNAVGARLDDVLSKNQQPVIAYIAGNKEKRTAKDHIFAPGEMLDRNILIMNNGRASVDLKCQWKLTLNNQVAATGAKQVTVDAGGQVMVPVNVDIPKDMGDQQGTLDMKLVSDEDHGLVNYQFKKGEVICKDSCEIDIIAPIKYISKSAIAVIDPIGDSVKTMEKIGIPFQRLNFQADLHNYKTIIFGRNAFKYEMKNGIDLEALIRAGKNILILEQNEEILRKRFGFRTEHFSPRIVFEEGDSNPIFKGLSNRVLNNWRGAATLYDWHADILEELTGEFPNNGFFRTVIWNDGKAHPRQTKWGNTHNVATVLIIKPDSGNFRTLVDCGFALNYSAVLELLNNNGRVIFNQLDVSGRTESDPAAERFLKNLIGYTETARKPIWKTTKYLGGIEGENLLKLLRIDTEKIQLPRDLDPNDVLIVGDVPKEKLVSWRSTLTKFVHSGGTLFSLPKNVNVLSSRWLPFKLQAQEKQINSSRISGINDDLFKGLGNSDFYWQSNVELPVITKVDVPALILDSGVLAKVDYGKGKYIFCQFSPASFNLDTHPWLRTTRQYAARTINCLLNNLHVKLQEPLFMRSLKSGFRLARTIDLKGEWYVTPTDDSDNCPSAQDKHWKKIILPGSFQQQTDLKKIRGYVWLRHSFDASAVDKNKKVKLMIGSVSGADWTYINGQKVGSTTASSNPDFVGTAQREYIIPDSLLKDGKNEITMRVYFDKNASLGMSDTDGSILSPCAVELFEPNTGLENSEICDMAPIDLIGIWQGLATKTKISCPASSDSRWHQVKVPDQYDRVDAKNYPAEWKSFNGYFWYRKTFNIPGDLPANAEPFLLLGGVDDEDTTYLNGKFIGHLGKDNYMGSGWTGNVLRKYPIKKKYFKKGENEITVLVYDPVNNGGIFKKPVEIIFSDPIKVEMKDLLDSPYLFRLNYKDDPYRASWY